MNTKLDFVCDIIVGRSVNGPTELRRRPAAMRTESVGMIQALRPPSPYVARAVHQSAPARPATRTVCYAPRALDIETNLSKYSNQCVD